MKILYKISFHPFQSEVYGATNCFWGPRDVNQKGRYPFFTKYNSDKYIIEHRAQSLIIKLITKNRYLINKIRELRLDKPKFSFNTINFDELMRDARDTQAQDNQLEHFNNSERYRLICHFVHKFVISIRGRYKPQELKF